MLNPRDNWWAPVWCGLVVDPEGRHVRRLGMAGWLLLYLIVHANRQTGIVTSYRPTIARRMGIPLRTSQRWLSRLEREGYVVMTTGGNVPRIRILRWKSLAAHATAGARGANSGAWRARNGAKSLPPSARKART